MPDAADHRSRNSQLEAELNDVAALAAREHQRAAQFEATIEELETRVGVERRRADAAERELTALREQLPGEWDRVKTFRKGTARWRHRR